MENDKITYKSFSNIPDKKVYSEITELYEEIFEDADLAFFKQGINTPIDLLILLAYHNKHLVGLKIGYRYDLHTFYSWIGGVKDDFRNRGIAKQLALLQEQWAKQHGYVKLITKSMNRFKAMMIMNLKNGFEITKVYTNTKEQTKIVFEKQLG